MSETARSQPQRRLGRSGLPVTPVSVGTWLTFGSRLGEAQAADLVRFAVDRGVLLFDTAAGYGPSEAALGAALRAAEVPRDDVVVSTKLFPKRTLSRKHVLWTADESLRRTGLDFVDVISAHRYDPQTPLPEVVRAFSDLVERGKALYWGTSHWTAAQMRAALALCERDGLHPPVCLQPGYSLVQRKVVEVEYADLLEETGLGLMTYSPVGFGLLAGKYLDGTPADSRAGVPDVGPWLVDALTSRANNDRVRALARLAEPYGATPAQLAMAWALTHPRVSTVITAPESIAELTETLGGVALAQALTAETRLQAQVLFAGIEIEPDGF